MNNFVSKMWKMHGALYFLFLWIAASCAALPSIGMSLNGMSSVSVKYVYAVLGSSLPSGFRISASGAVAYAFLTGLVVAFFSFLFIKIACAVFGAIYARSYGKFATVGELPIDKKSLCKLAALYAVACDLLLALARLISFFIPMTYFLIEYVAKPLIFGIMFFPFFFLIRKYFLEGRVSYNVLLAMSIPFFIFLVLFC